MFKFTVIIVKCMPSTGGWYLHLMLLHILRSSSQKDNSDHFARMEIQPKSHTWHVNAQSEFKWTLHRHTVSINGKHPLHLHKGSSVIALFDKNTVGALTKCKIVVGVSKLWPRDAMSYRKSRSTLVVIRACCLMPASHHLMQYRIITC